MPGKSISEMSAFEYLRTLSDENLLTTFALSTPVASTDGKRKVFTAMRGEVLRRLTDRKKALEGVEQFYRRPDEDATDAFERVAEAFHRATGFLRPGKSEALEFSSLSDREELREKAWKAWVASFATAVREALS